MTKRSVFWVVEGKLLAFPFDETATVGIAKSGNTFNHKLRNQNCFRHRNRTASALRFQRTLSVLYG